MTSSLQTKNSKEVHIFFGVSGSGKSSTINKLCREDKCVVGDDESSETQNCKLVHVEHQDSIFYGKYLLDMQGYNDTRPEHNQAKMFEMMKLYFLESDITTIKSIIFVINISDTKTNFYRRFAQFLGQLFQKEQVERNSIVLLTKGDRLSVEEKETKIENIRKNLSELVDNHGWPSMPMIEWSNKKPLPDQEQKLFNVIKKLQGFNSKKALQEIENEIDIAVQKLYDSLDNIKTVKHNPTQELKEFKIDRQVEDHVVINCDRTEEIIVPKQTEIRTLSVDKIIHFIGGTAQNEGLVEAIVTGATRLNSVLGINYLVSKFAGRIKKTQTKTIQFDHKVTSVTFDKTPDDISLLDQLNYEIDPDNERQVKITADFSWGGSVVTGWDFDVKVTAILEQSVVTKEEYKNKIVIPQQRIEKVMKNVTDTEQRLVTVQEAYEEQIHKLTKEEIKKSFIHERIIKLS